MLMDVGARWDRVSGDDRVNWWSSDKCQAYYNQAVCGRLLKGSSAGCRRRLADEQPGRRFARAVSVGCGPGLKEMAYLTDDLVDHFDLWELAPGRIAAGERAAASMGLGARVTFHRGNAFQAVHEKYDLVHWDHSLHHMMDVRAALAWSRAVLNPGGVVLINDYIGPNRLQWTKAEVARANRFLAEAGAPMSVPPSTVLSHLKMRLKDPSEAPQSELIAQAIPAILPGAAVEPLGGTLLNILGGVVIPVTNEDDPLVEALIQADDQMRRDGSSHFAFALWQAP